MPWGWNCVAVHLLKEVGFLVCRFKKVFFLKFVMDTGLGDGQMQAHGIGNGWAATDIGRAMPEILG